MKEGRRQMRAVLIPFLASLTLSFFALFLAVFLAVLFSDKSRTALPASYKEQEVKEQARAAVDALAAGEYGTVVKMFGEEMGDFSEEELSADMNRAAELKGKFREYESIVVMGYRQEEAVYAIAAVSAKYEKGNVVYTITFNEDLEIIGLFYQ